MLMIKKTTNKTVKKQTNDFEPNRVAFVISFVAVLTLVLFAGLALIDSL